MGTQKNSFNEMVLLSTQNMFKLMGKKILTILHSKFCLSKPVVLVGFSYAFILTKMMILILVSKWGNLLWHSMESVPKGHFHCVSPTYVFIKN